MTKTSLTRPLCASTLRAALLLSTVFVLFSLPHSSGSPSTLHALSSPIFQYSSAHTTLARMQRFSLTPSEFPSTHYAPDYFDCSSRRYSSSTPSCARLFVCTCTVLSCSISSSFRDTSSSSSSHTPPSLLMYTNNPFYCLILASHPNLPPIFSRILRFLRRNSAPPILWTYCQIAARLPTQTPLF